MASERKDIHAEITSQIIAQIEAGCPPWRRPWNGGHAAGRITRPLRWNDEKFNGINILTLWAVASAKGYENPYWLTFRQAQALGGQVRKGEKGTQVVFASTLKRREENDAGEDEDKVIPYLKVYTSFNAQQVDGLPDKYYAQIEMPHLTPMERDEAAEEFFRNTGARIEYGGNRAYYSQSTDHIQMPPMEAFEDYEKYLSTKAHEAIHWSKHPSRLNRDLGRKKWGDEGYGHEEIVAEIGSCILAAELGISPLPTQDNAAYIASWLKALRNDKRFIFSAASHASKAADFLHSLQPAIETPSPSIIDAPGVPLEIQPLPTPPIAEAVADEPPAPPAPEPVQAPAGKPGWVAKERTRRETKTAGQGELLF